MSKLCQSLETHNIVKQGENLGRNGIDTTPSDVRSAPEAPVEVQSESTSLPVDTKAEGGSSKASASKPLPRETGDDIGFGSPVPLSAEAVRVITNLRNLKVSRYSLCIHVDLSHTHFYRMKKRIGVDGETSCSKPRVNFTLIISY